MPNGVSQGEKKRRARQKKILTDMNRLLENTKINKETAESANKKGKLKKEIDKKRSTVLGLIYAERKKDEFMRYFPFIYEVPFPWWHLMLSQINESLKEAIDELRKHPTDYEKVNKLIQGAIDKKALLECKLPK